MVVIAVAAAVFGSIGGFSGFGDLAVLVVVVVVVAVLLLLLLPLDADIHPPPTSSPSTQAHPGAGSPCCPV